MSLEFRRPVQGKHIHLNVYICVCVCVCVCIEIDMNVYIQYIKIYIEKFVGWAIL